MKTVTKQQAAQGFDMIGDLAHAGETVICHPRRQTLDQTRARSQKKAGQVRRRLSSQAEPSLAQASEVLSRLRR
jgi:hypothetical protein